MFVVADFVGQNGDEFVGGVLGDKSVKENDAFETAKTGKVGVAFGGATGTVHGVDALELKMLFLGEGLDGGFEFTFGKRCKFVKKGHDENWGDEQEEELE